MGASRNRAASGLLWVAVGAARRLASRADVGALSVEDLVQEGAFGVLGAMDSWDAQRGAGLSAYAYSRARFAMLRAVQNQGRLVRLPVHVLERLWRVRRRMREGENVGEEDARFVLDVGRATVSLDGWESGGRVAGEIVVDGCEDAARVVEHAVMVDGLRALVVEGLGDMERDVVLLRFGLCDGVPRTAGECAHRLGLSLYKVRKSERSGIEKLRAMLTGGEGQGYYDWLATLDSEGSARAEGFVRYDGTLPGKSL